MTEKRLEILKLLGIFLRQEITKEIDAGESNFSIT